MTHDLALYAALPSIGAALLEDGGRGLEEALARASGLEGMEKGVDRVYLGSEFCSTQLPRPGALVRLLALVGGRGLAATLVLPVIWEKELARAERLLALFSEKAGPGAEVVCNDFGLLRHVSRAYPQMVPVAGRLMTKTIRDPRFGFPPHPDFADHPDVAFGSGLQTRPAGDLLRKMGVKRIEVDGPGEKVVEHFDGGGERKLSLHFPWWHVTSSRICAFAGMSRSDGPRFQVHTPCGVECARYAMRYLEQADGTVVQLGNAVLWKSDRPAPSLGRLSQPVRVVYNPFSLPESHDR